MSRYRNLETHGTSLSRSTSSSTLQNVPPASDPTGLALRTHTPHQRHPSHSRVRTKFLISSHLLSSQPKILLEDRFQGFGFVRHNPLPPKPRKTSVTEIHEPYYSAMSPNYLSDVLTTMGSHVDSLKIAGSSFSLFAESELRKLIELAHSHHVY